MNSTDVWLIRHGQSYSNMEHRLCGHPPGPGLTPLGERQSIIAAHRVLDSKVPPGPILSSPLRRARDSAIVLSASWRSPITTEERLRETSFGTWEGHTIFQLQNDPHFRSWVQDPEATAPPGGERLSEVAARTVSALEDAARQTPGGTVVAFSHMHALLGFALHVLGYTIARHRDFGFGNCSCVRARFSDTWQFTGFYSAPDAKATDLEGDPVYNQSNGS